MINNPKQIIQADSYQEGFKIVGIVNSPAQYRNDIAVVFIAGFERFGYEQKWRLLTQELNRQGIATLQFDFTGLGLSDGIYNEPTMEHLLSDLKNLTTTFKQQYNVSKLILVGHSLGACVAISAKNSMQGISKLILLAPALNQKELNRYRYAMSTNKNKELTITFDNYKDNFNESDYQLSIQQTSIKKANIILPSYMQQMSDIDYTTIINDDSDILIIHGDKDNTVPLNSLSHLFTNTTIVSGGDHDLEKPGIIEKRIHTAIDFVQ
ncbi:MAG TPA: alpha/beta fold hydrolase [Candidatus Absconditabacterales bacterium]|nr:alpha/beta fold hydrolase [Candidatus Absconditabacterales bacterium]HNG96829.1 alpha/beta fold hydrolase [Candidatus Absconditabacterales bacterium]